MNSDHNTNAGRLYREIMREARQLGDKYLVDLVLRRLANLSQPLPVPPSTTNVISFPRLYPAASQSPGQAQPLWMTILRTASIPLGMGLILVIFHFISAYATLPCQP